MHNNRILPGSFADDCTQLLRRANVASPDQDSGRIFKLDESRPDDALRRLACRIRNREDRNFHQREGDLRLLSSNRATFDETGAAVRAGVYEDTHDSVGATDHDDGDGADGRGLIITGVGDLRFVTDENPDRTREN